MADTIFTQTLAGSSGEFATHTIRQLLANSLLTAPAGTPAQIRVTLKAGASAGVTFAKMYIGNQAASGDAWDADAMVQLLFSGSAGATIAAGGTLVSDWLAFAWNTARGIIVTQYTTATGGSWGLLSLSGATSYIKISTDDAATANGTGYVVNDASRVYGVQKIETQGAGILRQMMQHHHEAA